jgi:hypothetical protein
MAPGWKLKFMFLFVCLFVFFMGRTREPLHSDEWSLVSDRGLPVIFISIIILFDEAFKYDDDAKCWDKRWTTV